MNLERIFDQEIMDDEKQVFAYARADFSSSNQLFVDKFVREFDYNINSVLDLGTGPADIPVRLVKADPTLHVIGIDASSYMIKYAKEKIESCNLNNKISVLQGRMPGLKTTLKDIHYDAILSKDLLHHFPDPFVFWNEIKDISKTGTIVFIMDLIRPDSKKKAMEIVESVAANEHDVLKDDFYNSLLSAFEIYEVIDQLRTVKLDLNIEMIGDRHFLAKGIIK